MISHINICICIWCTNCSALVYGNFIYYNKRWENIVRCSQCFGLIFFDCVKMIFHKKLQKDALILTISEHGTYDAFICFKEKKYTMEFVKVCI